MAYANTNYLDQIGLSTGEFDLLLTLDEDKPEKETLKKLIHAFPSSLEYKNEDGQLPIQSAAWNMDIVGYVPPSPSKESSTMSAVMINMEG